VAGTLVLGVAVSIPYGAIFLLSSAAPTAYFTHLIGLARTDETGREEWYPLGRILMLSALITGGILMASAVVAGMNEKTFSEFWQSFVKALVTQSGAGGTVSDEQLRAQADTIASMLPVVASGMAVAISILNLWLGAWIIRRSDRLTRPWQSLTTCEMPPKAAMLFVGLVLLDFIPGDFGYFAGYLTGALGMAFMLIGLSVLHTVTRGTPGRPLILIAAYGAIVVTLQAYMLAALLFTLLGWAETFLGIRQRRGPPPRKGNGIAPD